MLMWIEDSDPYVLTLEYYYTSVLLKLFLLCDVCGPVERVDVLPFVLYWLSCTYDKKLYYAYLYRTFLIKHYRTFQYSLFWCDVVTKMCRGQHQPALLPTFMFMSPFPHHTCLIGRCTQHNISLNTRSSLNIITGGNTQTSIKPGNLRHQIKALQITCFKYSHTVKHHSDILLTARSNVCFCKEKIKHI